MPRLHPGAANNRRGTTRAILLPVPELVRQQPPNISAETSRIVNTHKDPTIKITQTKHMPESQEEIGVESQTSPVKGTWPQKYGFNWEPVQEIDTRSKPVPLLNNSRNSQLEIQKTKTDSTANSVGKDNITPLTITAPQIEEILVRKETRMNSICHCHPL